MDPANFILALISCLPDHQVRGRKRLQKLAYFACNKGAPVDVKFILHDFGPFCPEIANATQMLTFFGDLQETDEPIGRAKHIVKVYKIPNLEHVRDTLDTVIRDALRVLSDYNTVELEIASTLLYFYKDSSSWDRAVEETKNLKPSKAEASVISRAFEALKQVGLDERGRTN